MSNSVDVVERDFSKGPIALSSDVPGISASLLGKADPFIWDAAFYLGSMRMEELRVLVGQAHQRSTQSSYMLAIGLARIDGNREVFDDLAVEYAVHFGESPPNWIDQHNKSSSEESEYNSHEVTALTANNIIETTIKMESPWPLLIDLSSALEYDTFGIELYNQSMFDRTSQGVKTRVLTNKDLIAKMVRQVMTEPLSDNDPLWRFLFLCYQFSGQQKEFESLATTYVTKGGEVIEWKDLSDREKESLDRSSAGATGFVVGERLSEVNASLAAKVKESTAFKKAMQSKQALYIDFTGTKYASMIDAFGVHGFLDAMGEQPFQVQFYGLNELLHQILLAVGVGHRVTMTTAGAAVSAQE